ncbi:MAG TPA: ABC transporter ATP-binding protein [Sphingobacteriaceae bacterium]
MIVAENICKRFNGLPAVTDLSFTIQEGETMVLLGTSGCGKTTTLRMINRLIEPSSGTILIGNRKSTDISAEVLRRSMGYVLQHHGLFPHYTVGENIAIVPKLLKWDKQRIADRVAELMHKFRLPADYASALPSELSGGQMQRVGLARALAANPPILLMDEPFGALDIITRRAIRKSFIELDEFKRKTIVLVTHDVEEAFELGDQICLMDQGKMVQCGTPQELLFHPANDLVKHFFDQQRLQLEWKFIKLHQLWAFLPASESQDEGTITSSSNLWDAMELFARDPSLVVTVTNTETGEKKKMNSRLLFSAFEQFKGS